MKSKPMTREEEVEAVRAWRERRDQRALTRILTSNAGLVNRAANKYAKACDREDLVQQGMLGMLVALEKFEPERGLRFTTYAMWWVRASLQTLVHGVLSSGMASRRAARTLSQQQRKVAAAEAQFGPGLAEVAQQIGISMEALESAKSVYRAGRTSSLHSGGVFIAASRRGAGLMRGDDYGDSGPAECDVPDDDPTPDEAVLVDQLEARRRESVRRALACLTDLERFVVEARYFSEKPMTLVEVGERMAGRKCTKEWARQVEGRALAKLRRALGSRAAELVRG